MRDRHWTWQELIDTPLHVILAISFFNKREEVFNRLQTLKKEKGEK